MFSIDKSEEMFDFFSKCCCTFCDHFNVPQTDKKLDGFVSAFSAIIHLNVESLKI